MSAQDRPRPPADARDERAIDIKQRIRGAALTHRPVAIELSHEISDHPELAFAERRACTAVCERLAAGGYAVHRPVAGLDTAFIATAGTGRRVIGLCAEYDALPLIGHACGHNVIAGASVLAALSLRPFLDELDLTARVLGTPAEEDGGGKVIMLDAGLFDGLDAVLMAHPAPHDMLTPTILAMALLDVEFAGFTPPSMYPERGRSAADAVTLTQVAVGLLRQHLRRSDRITGHVVEEGASPNVLPSRARLRYCVRAPDMTRLTEVIQRFEDCVRGAALASGTEAHITEPQPRYDAMRHHPALVRLYRDNAVATGRSFSPHEQEDHARSASTDFGNVSQIAPAIHPLIGIDAAGASNHQEAFTTHCRGESGDRAVADAGLALAWTIADVALCPQVLDVDR